MNKTGKLEQQVKKQLDDSIEDLDPAITRRLQQARYSAIEKASTNKGWAFYQQAKYAMFAIAIVAVTLLYNVNVNDSAQTTLAMESDIEMLTSNESLDLMQDLEFMQWLAESNQDVS